MSTAQVQRGGRSPEVAARPGAGRTFTVLLGHVLGLQARSVAIWGAALGAMGVMMVSIFPAIADGPGLEQMTDALPQGMMEAVGVGDIASMSTITGFLEAEIFGLVLPLAIPFFAILAAAGAIAGAEENGTIDVLMSNPLPRWQLVAAYFVSTAVALAGILALFGLILWGSAQFIDAELTDRHRRRGRLRGVASGPLLRRARHGGVGDLPPQDARGRPRGGCALLDVLPERRGRLGRGTRVSRVLLRHLLLRRTTDRRHRLGQLHHPDRGRNSPRGRSGLRLPEARHLHVGPDDLRDLHVNERP